MAVSTTDLSALQRQFHANYYPPHGTPWPPLQYHGVPCAKIATDLWSIGQLVWDVRPGLIIETGTAAGGTALFLADQMDAIGHGRVFTIDVQPCAVTHPRIVLEHGASTLARIVARATAAARSSVAAGRAVCVILDSAHDAGTVAAELAAYAPLVTPQSYLIVEDMNLGRTVMPEHGPGPAAAVEEYLAAHPGEWEVDVAVQPPITCHPNGWLRRIA